MLDLLLIVGHSPSRPGARNKAADLYEFNYNLPIVTAVASGLGFLGYDVEFDTYRGSGNVARWSGASRALVEFHCNAFNGEASGTEVLYAHGSEAGEAMAQQVLLSLVACLGLPNRRSKPITREDRGGYLVHGVSQPAIIPEPFFIDNDADLEVAQRSDIVHAYTSGIDDAIQAMG